MGKYRFPGSGATGGPFNGWRKISQFPHCVADLRVGGQFGPLPAYPPNHQATLRVEGGKPASRQTANMVRPLRPPHLQPLSGGLFHSSAATTQPRRHPGPRCQAHRPRGEGKGRYRLNMKLQNAGPRALGTLSPEAPDGIQESGYRFPESSGSIAQLLQYRQQVCLWNHKTSY